MRPVVKLSYDLRPIRRFQFTFRLCACPCAAARRYHFLASHEFCRTPVPLAYLRPRLSLGGRVTLFRGHTVPFHGLPMILPHTSAGGPVKAQGILGFRITLFSSRQISFSGKGARDDRLLPG